MTAAPAVVFTSAASAVPPAMATPVIVPPLVPVSVMVELLGVRAHVARGGPGDSP